MLKSSASTFANVWKMYEQLRNLNRCVSAEKRCDDCQYRWVNTVRFGGCGVGHFADLIRWESVQRNGKVHPLRNHDESIYSRLQA